MILRQEKENLLNSPFLFNHSPPQQIPADRVARSALRGAALLPTADPDANAIAPHFGKRTKKRLEEINQILTTLKNLGSL